MKYLLFCKLLRYIIELQKFIFLIYMIPSTHDNVLKSNTDNIMIVLTVKNLKNKKM